MNRSSAACTRAVLLGALAATCSPPAPAQQNQVCERQLHDYVTQRFGQTVQRIEFDWRYGKRGDGHYEASQALVYPNECSGFHAFDLLASPETCQYQAHYGTPPDYLWYRSSSGGCARPR